MQFTLTEKLSNPERVETRRSESSVQQQSGNGESVVAPSAEPDAPELGGFERILKRVDDYVGPVR
ncbi:baseplate complex protein [Pseudomonas graminis]